MLFRSDAAGVCQYEISNFARAGFASRHNLKYWKRQPYLGFGVDAHSMLPSGNDESESVRFSTADSLEQYMAAAPLARTPVSAQAALEEIFFLGLRLTEGVNLAEVRKRFGNSVVDAFSPTLAELLDGGLIDRQGDRIRLTARGRIVKDSSGELALQVAPNPSFILTPNDLSKGLETVADTQLIVTVRGQLYKKPAGKKKADLSAPLKLLILEVQKKE